MTTPLVSVVMPTFNGAKTVRAALDSVFAQTFKDYEVIVVDDASTDDTPAMLKGYEGRITLAVRASNSGICEVARSQALEMARGRYAAFIDQDDLWAPAKLEKQVAFMERHPEIPLSHTYMKVIDEQGREHGVRHDGAIPPTGPCAEALLRNCFITISSIVVRREVWLNTESAAKLADAHSDWDYFLRILQKYPAGFGFIPEVLGAYRRWPANMSRLNWRKNPRDWISMERVYREGIWRGLVAPEVMRDIVMAVCFENCQFWRDRGYGGRAMYFALQAVRRQPFEKMAWSHLAKSAVNPLVRALRNGSARDE